MNDSQLDHIVENYSLTYKFFTTTVSLTTSYMVGQKANVMANEWVMNVCWEPLRIMTLIEQESFTHELVSASGEFGINICSVNQAHIAHYAGNVSGRQYDKLAHPIFKEQTYPGIRIKAPMIKGCVLNAECTVEEKFEFGNYTAFIGRAFPTRVNQKLRPLLYHRGKFFPLGNQVPKSIEVELE